MGSKPTRVIAQVVDALDSCSYRNETRISLTKGFLCGRTKGPLCNCVLATNSYWELRPAPLAEFQGLEVTNVDTPVAGLALCADSARNLGKTVRTSLRTMAYAHYKRITRHLGVIQRR